MAQGVSTRWERREEKGRLQLLLMPGASVTDKFLGLQLLHLVAPPCYSLVMVNGFCLCEYRLAAIADMLQCLEHGKIYNLEHCGTWQNMAEYMFQ